MLEKRHSITGKIFIITALALIISNISIGILGYNTAKRELSKQGEDILKNGLKAANNMIHIAQNSVKDGGLTLEEAENLVKENLIGKLNPDGTRDTSQTIDLGENGYFFILNEKGDLLGHPYLEGQNTWDFKDESKKEVLFVQESIETALNGGGFIYYDWKFPNSDGVGRKIVYNEKDTEWGWIICAGSYEKDFNKGATKILKATIFRAIAFLIVGDVIVYILTHKIGNSLRAITSRADDIANLDISDKVSDMLTKRKDEVGILGGAFQKIIDNLKGFVDHISHTSQDLALSSRELSLSSEQSSASIGEIARAIEDIAEGASKQAMDIENGVAHIDDLGRLVEKNQEFLKELNDSTLEIEKIKDEGLEILMELVRNTETSNKATTDIQNVIYDTNESAEKIEKASNMIRSITEQTNILALNAAIEAARAGESGRGFAVVADEIRKLAEQTNGFTKEITLVVSDLLDKTKEAVNTMDNVVEASKIQSNSVEETNEKFDGIRKAIESSNSIIELINQSGIEMLQKKEAIVDIIYELSAISQENAAGAEEAAASIEEQTATMAEIANASELLSQLAKDMEENLSRFKY
ncbi:methyl-accepting chemotaxis protein [Tissierella pigra]|uniref:Methyl-accepting chemotaxis protein n=1 Tax=Tissierella pigra TaxID=2607614 RepID=A0A6N7XUL7_9FIRM|nr:methyl-accepting chemotaxis protein [Tissierella pigra]MSU00224.1 methyl-accepting chemotaxis protein [Tissierella pigra]